MRILPEKYNIFLCVRVEITLKEIKVSGKTAKICPKNNRSNGVIIRANYENDNNL